MTPFEFWQASMTPQEFAGGMLYLGMVIGYTICFLTLLVSGGK